MPEQVSPPPEENKSHPNRYYVSESSNTYKYILPADEEEKQRLNIQGQMINKAFDDKLIWAPITLKDGDVVLDSGTGSGQWLLALAKEVPQTVNLHGIDISPRMFPLSSSVPPNATFSPLSVTSLPENWTNTISIIHQRLLAAALQVEQWKAALSEMYRVLAPGGWVQLFEPKDYYVSPSKAIREHRVVTIGKKLSSEIRHIVLDVVQHLQAWLEEAGFVNIKVERRGLPLGSWAGEHGIVSSKSTLGVLPSIKPLVIQEGLVASEEEYDALVDDITKLCDETPETFFEVSLFVAQKPDVLSVYS